MYYGYFIVAAGLLASLFIVGIWTTFGIFFKPLSSEFGWTRATTSIASSVASIVMGISGILTGRLTDRFGPKVVLIGSGVLMGAGTLLMSQINAVWQLYVLWGVLVGAGMSSSEIPIVAPIARWFTGKRGMMTGVAKVGAGLGMAVFPPLAAWLIVAHGWRTSYLIIGTLALLGIGSAALVFKRDPAEIGVQPYGSDGGGPEPRVATAQYSLHEALRTRQLWTFSLVWFSFMFVMMMVTVHTANHVTDIGLSTATAAAVVSLFGGFSILGRLTLPGLSDILGPRATYIMSFILLDASLLWFQFADGPWSLYLFAALYGTAHGSCFALLSPMTSRLFGTRNLGSILGIILFIGTIGSLISPTLAGRLYDITETYRPAYWISLGFGVVGLGTLFFLRPDRRR